MRYGAYLNDSIFFDTYSDLRELTLISANLSFSAGKSGTFTFSIAPENIAYGNFHHLIDYVDIYRDDEVVFAGRVLRISGEFNKIQTIVCEGLLSVLNDSIFRPEIFNGTLAELVARLIENHNSQVSEERQITIGRITVSDEYVYREYETYETTMSRISDLVEIYGGYISVKKENNGLIFDWIAEAEEYNTQGINFGENMIDLTTEDNAEEIVSVLIPLGEEVEDENGVRSRITIESVNNGLDYIQNDDALTQYGRIVGVEIWNDVTTPAALLSKGTAFLNQLALAKTTLNITAVDLSNAGYSIDSFHCAEWIKVTSIPHNISDVWFTIKNLELNLLNPSEDRLTLGDTMQGYVQTMGNKLKEQTEIIARMSNSTSQAIQNTIIQLRTEIESTSEEIAMRAIREEVDPLGNRISAVESQIQQTAEEISFYFGEDGRISTMFQFSEDGFVIGKSGDKIKSKQTNNSWALVDDSGNELLKADTSGMTVETQKVTAQVEWMDGQTAQWAIRKGQYITGKGVNLNTIWLGG